MSIAAVRSPHGNEDAYQAYYAEAAEEVRAVRVGEKETSQQAAIIAYMDQTIQGLREEIKQLKANHPDKPPIP